MAAEWIFSPERRGRDFLMRDFSEEVRVEVEGMVCKGGGRRR
jgi:hypothetical protein